MDDMTTALNNPGTTLTLKMGGGFCIPMDCDISGLWSWVDGRAWMNTIYIPMALAFPPSRLITISRKYKGVFFPNFQLKSLVQDSEKRLFISNHWSVLVMPTSTSCFGDYAPGGCGLQEFQKGFLPSLCVCVCGGGRRLGDGKPQSWGREVLILSPPLSHQPLKIA